MGLTYLRSSHRSLNTDSVIDLKTSFESDLANSKGEVAEIDHLAETVTCESLKLIGMIMAGGTRHGAMSAARSIVMSSQTGRSISISRRTCS